MANVRKKQVDHTQAKSDDDQSPISQIPSAIDSEGIVVGRPVNPQGSDKASKPEVSSEGSKAAAPTPDDSATASRPDGSPTASKPSDSATESRSDNSTTAPKPDDSTTVPKPDDSATAPSEQSKNISAVSKQGEDTSAASDQDGDQASDQSTDSEQDRQHAKPAQKRTSVRDRRKQAKEEQAEQKRVVEEWRKQNQKIFDSVLEFAQTDDIEEEEPEPTQTKAAPKPQVPKFKSNASFSLKKNNLEGGPSAVTELLNKQREYFESAITFPYTWRGRALARFNHIFRKYEKPLVEALHRDLGISRYEAYLTEIAPVYEEFKNMKANYRKWTDKASVRPVVSLLPTTYKTYWQPLGCSCIINSWQSPVMGVMVPMISALAAGCTITVKNSNRTRRCNEVLAAAINELFKPECVKFIYGDDELDKVLANAGYDKVYYCGTRENAPEIMMGMATSLSSPTMMLDGNCPCYVDQTVDLEMAAKRIMSGKMIHAGQTRVSPSWAFVHQTVIKKFVNRSYQYIKKTYGDNPIEHPDYPRMFSKKEYDEACALLEGLGSKTELVYGGERDPKTLKIAPTVILVDSINHSIFRKKIIGPILPVVAYESPESALNEINKFPTPPAFYLFTRNKPAIRYATLYVEFGDGCVNDTMVQVANRKSQTSAFGTMGIGAIGSKAGVDSFGIRKTVASSNRHFAREYRFMPFPKSFKKLQRMFRTR